MTKDLTVSIQDRPGTLARVAEALGAAGVNIEGIGGFAVYNEAVAHLLLEDGDVARARNAIEEAGANVEAELDVIVVELTDRPGALGALARRIADAGVNLNLVYMATRTRLVVGSDDLRKLRAALGA